MAGVLNWGWDYDNKIWRKLKVNDQGQMSIKAIVDYLNDIGDVTIEDVADGHFISWSDGLGYWQNRVLAEGDIPAEIARDDEVATAVSDHAALLTGIHGMALGASVKNSADHTLTHEIPTTLAWDSEDWDTDNIHDNVTNNSRLTCRTAGKYMVTLMIRFDPNATGERHIWLAKGGVNIYENTVAAMAPAGAPTIVFFFITLDLAVDDYLEMKAYQDSGGDLNDDYTRSRFQMQRIG